MLAGSGAPSLLKSREGWHRRNVIADFLPARLDLRVKGRSFCHGAPPTLASSRRPELLLPVRKPRASGIAVALTLQFMVANSQTAGSVALHLRTNTQNVRRLHFTLTNSTLLNG